MKILHRYILVLLLRNLFLSLLVFCMLFLISDFFDRIDNVLASTSNIWTIVTYFLFKIPVMISYTLPIAMLVSAMFTIAILSKNSEITAMRATGLPIFWISMPVVATGLILSCFTIVFNETLVPYCARRVREIYNIDIKQKHLTGTFSQSDFWWRDRNGFYSVDIFDSRNNSLFKISKFSLDNEGQISSRIDAASAKWIDPILRWNMSDVTERVFKPGQAQKVKRFAGLPLVIDEEPKDFYDVRTDPNTMSYFKLSRFINRLKENGVSAAGHLSDLYAKISFPFVIFVLSFAVIPFALKSARSGSLAPSFLFGLAIGFSYYAVHSFSLALGRAEIWPPLLAAWAANFVMLAVGIVLNLGAESPS
ncbi:MAG: LPS export ABC transporter permease LptG [Bdellovibrionales bacterium]|nr:LPS export ABC transporter permease LptG [Bdellovibrionales bacterium]